MTVDNFSFKLMVVKFLLESRNILQNATYHYFALFVSHVQIYSMKHSRENSKLRKFNFAHRRVFISVRIITRTVTPMEFATETACR